MKKFISFALIFAILFAFASCKKEQKLTENFTESNSEQQLNFTGEVIKANVYSVFADGTIKTSEIYFENGKITPQRISAGLTGATGLSFTSDIVTDEENKTLTVTFKENSSFVTGKVMREVDGYSFDGAEDIKTFMQISLKESIVKNLGEYEVIFK